jgi:hypothetical protein
MTRAQILEAIRRWHELYGEPPTMADWDPYRARAIGQEWRIARYRTGEWPSVKTVRNKFGRLSVAVASAGLTPRLQGQQRPDELPTLDMDLSSQLAHARDLRTILPAHERLSLTVRDVAKARGSDDAGDLRAALVAVAAAALSWADQT